MSNLCNNYDPKITPSKVLFDSVYHITIEFSLQDNWLEENFRDLKHSALSSVITYFCHA